MVGIVNLWHRKAAKTWSYRWEVLKLMQLDKDRALSELEFCEEVDKKSERNYY